MHTSRLALLLLMTFVIAGAACGQNWNSGFDTGALDVTWTFDVDTYTFNVSNPLVDNSPYQVVAWSLEPFNLAAPVEVMCPDGWEWKSKGGWNYFELVKNNEKYDIGGSALEPGEILTFKYTVGDSTVPVNPGGPDDSAPSFLAHVGAVNGVNNGKYVPYAIQLGQTWHEKVDGETVVQTPIPEPAGLSVIFSGFFTLACFRFKRARV